MKGNLPSFMLWMLIVLVLLGVFTFFQSPHSNLTGTEIPYSQFINEVDQRKVSGVNITGNEIRGEYEGGQSFFTYAPYDPSLVDRLQRNGVSITARPESGLHWLLSLLISWLPFVVLIGTWLFLARRMQRNKDV